MRREGEPSVEEILESVKKVIERDNREAAGAQKQSNSAGEGLIARPSAGLDGDSSVLDLGSAACEVDSDDETVGLIDDKATGAMRQSLEALAMLAEPSSPPKIVHSGETSLEGMVREMLRPMMAQWLDAHLPEIVERMVKAEIARIAGKKP